MADQALAAATVYAARANLRTVLADIDAGELGCSVAYRHRIEGAVLILETVTAERAGLLDAQPGSYQ